MWYEPFTLTLKLVLARKQCYQTEAVLQGPLGVLQKKSIQGVRFEGKRYMCLVKGWLIHLWQFLEIGFLNLRNTNNDYPFSTDWFRWFWSTFLWKFRTVPKGCRAITLFVMMYFQVVSVKLHPTLFISIVSHIVLCCLWLRACYLPWPVISDPVGIQNWTPKSAVSSLASSSFVDLWIALNYMFLSTQNISPLTDKFNSLK